MSIELSVVIPTRNRWPLLRRAVDSALAQRGVQLAILVVDDGSTDGSAERAESISDDRVTVVRQAQAGVAAARNLGIERATAPWIALLDDDDLWAPEKCRRQLDALAVEGAEVAYTSQVVVDQSLRFKRVLEAPDPGSLLDALHGSNCIGTPSSVIASREALVSTGGFDSRFSVLADWDLWLRLCKERRAAACAETLVAYVEHSDNLHLVHTDSIRREFLLLGERHRGLGDVHWSRWIASSHRRAGRRRRAGLAYLRTGIDFRSGRDLARALAIFGGERTMSRLAGAGGAPKYRSHREWKWLENAPPLGRI